MNLLKKTWDALNTNITPENMRSTEASMRQSASETVQKSLSSLKSKARGALKGVGIILAGGALAMSFNSMAKADTVPTSAEQTIDETDPGQCIAGCEDAPNGNTEIEEVVTPKGESSEKTDSVEEGQSEDAGTVIQALTRAGMSKADATRLSQQATAARSV